MQNLNFREMASDEFLKHAIPVALYYGFSPLERIKKDANIINNNKKKQKRRIHINRSELNQYNAEMHNALQTYMNYGFNKLPNPVLFYDSNTTTKKLGENESVLLTLQVIGSEKSIAEALVIKTALEILGEIGINNICIHINTTGGYTSTIKYNKELKTYFRKHVQVIPVSAQSALKKNAFQCLSYLYKKKHPVYDNAPHSMEFLSENSRKHLSELLEYFETENIPYVINKSLVEYDNYYPKTIFEIRRIEKDVDDLEDSTNMKIYAKGYRYDGLSKKMFRSSAIPATSIIFEFDRKGKDHNKLLNPKRIRQPKIHFIQFGFDAKLKSLNVLEQLRKAKVPVHQSLGNDKLTKQLEITEELGIPYTIIMGQKEVLDDTVIVRKMENRSQDIIPISELATYLKNKKI